MYQILFGFTFISKGAEILGDDKMAAWDDDHSHVTPGPPSSASTTASSKAEDSESGKITFEISGLGRLKKRKVTVTLEAETK